MDIRKHRMLILCLLWLTLSGTTSILFNGALDAAQAPVADSSRDWATLVQTTEMVVLALVARHRPQAIRAVPIGTVAAVATVAGALAAGLGTARGSAALVTVGTCLTSAALAWTIVPMLVFCSALPFRQMFACFVVGDLAAIPLSGLISMGGYIAALVCYAGTVLLLVLGGMTYAREPIADLAHAEPAADAAVTRPNAVLPLTHDLFVYIFLFCLAYGFALRYQHADGNMLAHWFIGITLAALAAYALMPRREPRADVLFNTAFAFMLGGFLLVLVDDMRLAVPASVALLCGNEAFCILMALALCAVAGRNRSNALPAIAWGHAVYYAGIEIGAQLGMAVTGFAGEAPLVPRATIAVILAGIMLYTLFSLRDFGFDKTIAAVEPDPAPGAAPTVLLADRIETRCNELIGDLGLTKREADVFRLLVRGNNTLRIQEELAITKNTLKYHVRHIYEKAGVHSQQELIDLVQGR